MTDVTGIECIQNLLEVYDMINTVITTNSVVLHLVLTKWLGKHKTSHCHSLISRVATVRDKYMENEIFSRSEKSQGIFWIAREI